MKVYIIMRYDTKLDFRSRLIIYKQILNNVILTFKCEAKI